MASNERLRGWAERLSKRRCFTKKWVGLDEWRCGHIISARGNVPRRQPQLDSFDFFKSAFALVLFGPMEEKAHQVGLQVPGLILPAQNRRPSG